MEAEINSPSSVAGATRSVDSSGEPSPKFQVIIKSSIPSGGENRALNIERFSMSGEPYGIPVFIAPTAMSGPASTVIDMGAACMITLIRE